ncbi:MAG: recombination protein RecR [Bacteroidota bacterium]|jgi:recombination protein RecR|nr:recombination mediator RecR [Chitinophagales bacterium]
MIYSSKLLENAVNAFGALPGIGKKSALRLVLHLLKEDLNESRHLADAITNLREHIKFCQKCHHITDEIFCSICANPARNKKQVCVVETIREVLAFENTQQYNGTYHVLGGVISPIDGIGPDSLNIPDLLKRVGEDQVEEIIMALNPTTEGDTTIFYLSKILKDSPVKITSIARGVSFGGELEYVDDLTLARSLATRLPYENYLVQNK